MKNPNAIWFQSKDRLKAQVTRTGENRYTFEVWREHVYPRWYPHAKTGEVVLKGNATSLPLAKKEVFTFFDKFPPA